MITWKILTMYIKHLLFVCISLISFVSVFLSAGKLMIFLSIPYKLDASISSGKSNVIYNYNQFHKYTYLYIWTILTDSIIWTSFNNTLLLSAFILQHSLMIQPYFKQFIHNIGLDVVSRSIYNLTTSITLLVKHICEFI